MPVRGGWKEYLITIAQTMVERYNQSIVYTFLKNFEDISNIQHSNFFKILAHNALLDILTKLQLPVTTSIQ
jgi:hypothetical protein